MIPIRLMTFITLILLGPVLSSQETAAAKPGLPEAVRKALEARLPGAEIDEVEVEEENGRTCYEVEAEKGAFEATFKFDAEGNLLEIEQEVAHLPEAVRRALHARHAGARLVEAEWTRNFHYEIEARIAGKERELKFRPDGVMMRPAKPDERVN